MNKISAKDISILISIKEPWDPGSPQKPQFLRSCLLYFTLVNVYELTNRKEGITIMQQLSCISQHHASHGCLKPFAGFWEREIVVNEENKFSLKKLSLYNF